MSQERPINFNAEMVRALLDGRKTQTRRAIKPQPQFGIYELKQPWHVSAFQVGGSEYVCLYGEVGDRLWVKEPYIIYQTIDHIVRPDGRAFSEVSDGLAAYLADGYQGVQDLREHVQMISECEEVITDGELFKGPECMPRWASRITLDITAIRVERLQDISEADIMAEGCPNEYLLGSNWFKPLWESIKGPGAWDANPWVWVIEFEVIVALEMDL